MSDTSTAAQQEINRFASLAAMSASHRDLLKRHREQGDTPEITGSVEQFILRGRATGALLDDEDDRWVAQGLLDYWATKVYRTGYEPPDGTLDEFDPGLAPELPDDLRPYVGLDAFRENENDVFFGRQALVGAALEILKSHRLLAVVGPSGSGKSSLAFGAVLPKLKSGALPGSEGWRYFKRFTPGQSPLRELARLVRPEGAGDGWVDEQSQTFLHSSSHFTLLIEHDVKTPAVIMVDQFEEIFTLCADEDARQAFIGNLVGLVQSPNARHILILALAADAVSQVARLPRLQALLENGSLVVNPPNAAELRDTVLKPAELVGLKFEDGLVEELVRGVLGEPAALPLLQFTLLKLWENRERNRLTWAAYRKIGGGRKALAHSADELYNSFSPDDQAACKRILLRLVRPTEGFEVGLNRVQRSLLYRPGEDRERVDRVLDGLLKAHLLRQMEGESPDDAQIEVAHEALVRNWPLLVEWLDEERANLRNRLRLAAAARQWKQLGREKGALLRGVMLHIAESYHDLSELEQEFVQASRDAAEAARREKEAARQRELEQAQALALARQRELEKAQELAEEQKRRADVEEQRAQEQTRTAQQLRRRAIFLTLALIFVAVFAFGTVGFARQSIGYARQADLNAQDAEQQASTANAASTDAVANEQYANYASTLAVAQQITAQAASTEAVAQQGTAVAESSIAATAQAEAEWQASIAFSRELASEAFYYLDFDPPLAMLLSVEAHRAYDTFESRDAMLVGLQRNLDQSTVQVGDPLLSESGYVNSVAFSRDGKVLAYGTADGAIVLWDVAEGAQLRELDGHTAQVFNLAFSPDGKTLASAGADGVAILWDYAAGAQIYETPRANVGILSVAFSPDGKTLAIGREDSRIVLWDVAKQESLRVLEGHRDRVWSVAWSPDGKRLASASGDSTARIWDVAKGGLLLNLRGGHTRAVRSVAWSPGGEWLASASQDGTIVLWDAASGKPAGEPLTDHNGEVLSVAFSRDGRILASGSSDRTVILWDMATLKPIDVLFDHSHWVMSVAFSPDSRYLASGSIDKSVVLREVVTQQQLGQSLPGGKGPVLSIAVDGGGSVLMAVRPAGGPVSLWNYTTNTRLAQLGAYQVAALSADGKIAALGSRDGAITLFSIADNKALPVVFARLDTTVLSLALSPDGKLLASSTCGETDVNGFCTDNRVQIWDAASGKLIADQTTPHTDLILSLAFSDDAMLLATGSQDKTIILWQWDAATLTQFGLPLAGHTDKVTALAFGLHSATLASGSGDGTLILWDGGTLQPMGEPLSGHTGAVAGAAFYPDGAALISGSSDGSLIQWETGPETWEKRACEVAQRNLTRYEWNVFISDDPDSYQKTCEQYPEGQ